MSSAPPSATWGIFLFAPSRCSVGRRHSRRGHSTHAEPADALRDRHANHRVPRAQRSEDDTAARRATREGRVAGDRVGRWHSAALGSRVAADRCGHRGRRRVVPIPGASAMLAALVASGLEVGRFTFFGFLTRTGSERRSELDEISRLRHTAVCTRRRSGWRDARRPQQRGSVDRPAAVAREMTKQFEEMRRGTVGDLRAYYEGRHPAARSCW